MRGYYVRIESVFVYVISEFNTQNNVEQSTSQTVLVIDFFNSGYRLLTTLHLSGCYLIMTSGSWQIILTVLKYSTIFGGHKSRERVKRNHDVFLDFTRRTACFTHCLRTSVFWPVESEMLPSIILIISWS